MKITPQTILKWGGWISLCFLFSSISWLAYELYFKHLINNYQVEQIELRLQENFWKNQEAFNELVAFSKEI